jgi:hypothetical protein
MNGLLVSFSAGISEHPPALKPFFVPGRVPRLKPWLTSGANAEAIRPDFAAAEKQVPFGYAQGSLFDCVTRKGASHSAPDDRFGGGGRTSNSKDEMRRRRRDDG